jgi:hypothetical protein
MKNQDYPTPETVPTAQQTECITSTATLFWRVFVPVFGTVFLAGLTFAMILISEENLALPIPALWARLAVVVLFTAWFILVKKTIWRLKRVDVNAEYLFVTNFWQTVRYPWSDVEKTEESRRMGRRLAHFHLRAAGRFGRVISFLPASHYDELMKNLQG